MSHPLARKIWTPDDARRVAGINPAIGEASRSMADGMAGDFRQARGGRTIVRPIVQGGIVYIAGGAGHSGPKTITQELEDGVSENLTATQWFDASDHTKVWATAGGAGFAENINLYLWGGLFFGIQSGTGPYAGSSDLSIDLLNASGASVYHWVMHFIWTVDDSGGGSIVETEKISFTPYSGVAPKSFNGVTFVMFNAVTPPNMTQIIECYANWDTNQYNIIWF